MSDEKRSASEPIPTNMRAILTDLQLMTIKRVESFGWDIQFVRREKVSQPVPVIADQTGKKLGIVEEDGRVNFEHGMRFRG